MHFLMYFYIIFRPFKKCWILSLIDIPLRSRRRQQCDKSNEYIIRLIIYESTMQLQDFLRATRRQIQSNFFIILDTHNL